MEEILGESERSGGRRLAAGFGAVELTALGIGTIIGTGIFVLTGIVAARYAGPAVVVSFLISGAVAALAALSYAELSAAIPTAGSSYAYTFASMGELAAWMIGWSLILEYLLAAVTVAVGWSAYFRDLLLDLNIALPGALTLPPFAGGIVNLPAVFVTVAIAGIAYRGTRESALAAKVVVAVKLAVVLLFIAVGVFKIQRANWTPFSPFGVPGILQGASIVFFAYLGFDAISTAAEEVKNPPKDLPRGVLGSLLISSLLYIVVAGVLTGMMPYPLLDTPSPLAKALYDTGVRWASLLISIGAIAGLTSVLLALVFAQSRVWMAMSRDGLLPGIFTRIHPRYRTPSYNTVLVGVLVGTLAAFIPVEILAEMVNIGTLAALTASSASVIILRKTRPDLKRPFKVPFSPFLPALSILCCLYLMVGLPAGTWARFGIWMALGLGVYALYGHRRSASQRSRG